MQDWRVRNNVWTPRSDYDRHDDAVDAFRYAVQSMKRPKRETNWLALVCILAIAIAICLVGLNLKPFPTVGVYEIYKPVTEQPVDEDFLELMEDPGYRIREVARDKNFDGEFLIKLAICESTLRPDAVGGRSDCFIGLYQWNICYTDITKECAFDLICSTEATIKALQNNEQWRWPDCI